MIDSFDVVLFDNDGVLVDTEPLFLRATQELLATVGVAIDAELIRAGVEVLPGVRSTLRQLEGLRPMAIVTSAERWDFDEVHSQTGILGYFEFVLAAGDYPAPQAASGPVFRGSSALRRRTRALSRHRGHAAGACGGRRGGHEMHRDSASALSGERLQAS